MNGGPGGRGFGRGVERWEVISALVITGHLLVVHVVAWRSGGPLWRDEVHTINTTSASSWGEFWSTLQYGSIPVLWPIVLKTWAAMGFGQSDLTWRVLGLAVGLGLLGGLWWTARVFNSAAPCLALPLVAGSPMVIFWGGTVHAWGFGTVMAVFMSGAIWRVVEETSARRTALATAVSLAAVHAVYYNAVILLALCCAGVAVGLARRDWRLPAVLVSVGAFCALSLLCYVPTIRAVREWNVLLRAPIGFRSMLGAFNETLGSGGFLITVAWWVLLVLTVVLCAYRVVAVEPAVHGLSLERALFLGTSLVVGSAAYALFVLAIGYSTKPWYFMAGLGFLATMIDSVLHPAVVGRADRRHVRVGALLVLTGAVASSGLAVAQLRKTNIDRAAEVVSREARGNDLVVVNPWWPGISFSRYYSGVAPWITLPDLPDHRYHRFDLIRATMLKPDPVAHEMDRVSSTLRGGGRVWVVGGMPFASERSGPDALARAPGARSGLHEVSYLHAWEREAAVVIQRHAERIELRCMRPEEAVNPFEDVRLYVASGRQGSDGREWAVPGGPCAN